MKPSNREMPVYGQVDAVAVHRWLIMDRWNLKMGNMFVRTVSGTIVFLVLLGLVLPVIQAAVFLDLEDLLPSKSDDIQSHPVLQEPYWYYGISWSENLSAPGFLDGRGVEYYKRNNAHSDLSVEFSVYLFSNASDAEAYCDTVVNQTESEGGFTEVPISNVFAVVYDYGTQEIGISWGVISNVVFKVAVYTANIVEDPTDQLISLTDLERTRILSFDIEPGVPSTPPDSPPVTVPEFPSIIFMPLLMAITLFVAKVISRTKQPPKH
jgi:hypothetical protein